MKRVIYFAAPLFTQAERIWNRRLTEAILKKCSAFEIFLPQEETQEEYNDDYRSADHVHYVIEQLGSLKGEDAVCHFLEQALVFIEDEISHPDTEEDRILIWEVSPTGEKRVVWHFSGWHWDFNAEDLVPGGLAQGVLFGHEKSLLYEELMKSKNS